MAQIKKKIKILIVGGTGFIGRNLVKKCLKLKWEVNVFHLKKIKKENIIKKVKYFRGNIALISDLKKIDKNFNYVVNCGGYVDHKNKKEVNKFQNIGCKNLVSIFKKRKIDLFLQLGSSAEYGKLHSPHRESNTCNPKSIYGKAKLSATKHLINSFEKKKFPCSILRLYQVFGEGQATNRIIPFVINACIKNQKFPCSDGKQSRDFIHVNQVISAIIKTLLSKNSVGEIINIGSGKTIKIKSLINRIKKILKSGKPDFGRIRRRNDENLKIYPSISKSYKILDWKPKNNFYNQLISVIKFQKKI